MSNIFFKSDPTVDLTLSLAGTCVVGDVSEATLTFDVEYRVNSGSWTSLVTHEIAYTFTTSAAFGVSSFESTTVTATPFDLVDFRITNFSNSIPTIEFDLTLAQHTTKFYNY